MTEGIISYATPEGGALAAVNEGQRAMLTQQTPKSAILTRKGKGGKTFSYVPHAWVTEKLNEAFGWAWSWDITDWRILPETDPTEVFVLGKLTVHAPHGDLVKTQFGSCDVKRDKESRILSIGDDLKAASSDALKKAASLLGIALDLYKADVKPVDDDHDSNLAGDPMTAYWAAARAKGLTQAEGAALLQKYKGNPDRALRSLTEIEARPEAPPTEGNGSKGNTATGPGTPTDLLKYVNERVQVPYENLTHLRRALADEGMAGSSWPDGKRNPDWWDKALDMALSHAQAKVVQS